MTWEHYAALAAGLVLLAGLGAFAAAVAWVVVRRRASAAPFVAAGPATSATGAAAQLAAALRAVQAEGVERGVERFADRIRTAAAEEAESKLAGAGGPKNQPP